jgi:hypothetical protein
VSSPPTSPTPNPDAVAKEFMLKEYEQIVQAFFEADKEKVTLFNYYITLITAPITLIAAIFGIVTIQGNVDLTSLQIERLPNFVGFTVMVIALAGFLMSIIISDSRMDALLYTRVLNKLRRYFVVKHGIPSEYLILPIIGNIPKYNELSHFRALGAELLFISGLDSLLLMFSIAILFQIPLTLDLHYVFILVFSFIGYFAAHIGFYYWFSKHREKRDMEKSACETGLEESEDKPLPTNSEIKSDER